MDTATLAIALAGLGTTGLASIVPTVLANRGTKDAWERGQRAEVYADALVYAGHLEDMIIYAVDMMDVRHRGTKDREQTALDLLNARMRLLAEKQIRTLGSSCGMPTASSTSSGPSTTTTIKGP